MLRFCCYGFIMALQIKILMMFAICMLQAKPSQTNRCVYIFADKADNINVVQQVNLLKADAKGIAERHIVFKVITWSATNQQQYTKWGIANTPFTVILIGIDNGEKLRSHQPVTLSKLFDVIDNMPMRREEIKHKL